MTKCNIFIIFTLSLHTSLTILNNVFILLYIKVGATMFKVEQIEKSIPLS